MTENIVQMEPWFDDAEANAIAAYVRSGGWLTEFKKTEELERMVAEYVGTSYCVMTVNGTLSLWLALKALDIGHGDEVLVPDLTMIASPNAVVLTGASPVLVDVEPKTLCTDLGQAETAITPRTKAMMYVPLNGRSGDMANVREFCEKHELILIEDAAQALGSRFQGKHLGTFGQIGNFSFSPPKIITTGQGGALVTSSEELYRKLRRLKDFGREQGGTDIHDDWGWNFKFTDLQAVIGIEQMKKLAWRVARKKEIYKTYEIALGGIPQVSFIPTNFADVTPWFVDIYVPDPDILQAHLEKLNIGTRRVYPAVHTQKIYRSTYGDKQFPIAERFAASGLWLPSSAKLTEREIDKVTSAIKKFYVSR